jgi:hypothetical protein
MQQEWEYRTDTENIEHGVTEDLHTKRCSTSWIKRNTINLQAVPSPGQWPYTFLVTGGSLQQVGAHLLLHLSSRKATLIQSNIEHCVTKALHTNRWRHTHLASITSTRVQTYAFIAWKGVE